MYFFLNLDKGTWVFTDPAQNFDFWNRINHRIAKIRNSRVKFCYQGRWSYPRVGRCMGDTAESQGPSRVYKGGVRIGEFYNIQGRLSTPHGLCISEGSWRDALLEMSFRLYSTGSSLLEWHWKLFWMYFIRISLHPFIKYGLCFSKYNDILKNIN